MDDLEDNWWLNLLNVKADKQKHQGLCRHRPDWWLEMGDAHRPKIISKQDFDKWWMTLGQDEKRGTGKAPDNNPNVNSQSVNASSTVSQSVSVPRNTETKAAPFHIHYKVKMSAVKSAKRHSDKDHIKLTKNTTRIPFDHPEHVLQSLH